MSAYSYYPTEQFLAKLARIEKTDPPGFRRIHKVIDRLLLNPADADGSMHGVYHGRLKKYVGRRDYRLIYHWCEECRKANRHLGNDCGHCERVRDHSVVFFDVHHKNEQARLKQQG